MPKLQSPENFVPNQVLTASALQNHVDGANPLPGFISEHPPFGLGILASEDEILVNDANVNQLRKATVNDLFAVGINIKTNVITGTGTNNLAITPGSGGGIALNGNVTISGTQTVSGSFTSTGKITASGTGALKIPVGTTAQRPSTPVAGDIRYNTTDDRAEVYSGTEWKATGGVPFDASGGVVTTVDGYRIHTFTVSGTFTPALNLEGKVEVLVVGAGGAGSGFSPHGGGGGGGDVVTGFLNIAKGTSPMTVIVGIGGGGAGGASSFGPFTANGGQPGSGYNGGTSGSGIGGGSGNFTGSGGGAGAQATQTFKWTDAGGVGGQGYGSSISGTLRVYGGGGGGGHSGSGKASAPGIYGGGGQGVGAVANSGGGGGGGPGATNGADGIVIIRYRIS